MAAPVLTLAQQKAALRKNKKKAVLKNVLGLPKSFKVESQTTTASEAERLKSLLERLLPSARLPIQRNVKCKDATQPTPEEKTLKETAQQKRKQLSLGVNDLNKSIKKGLIAAALLANDIEPNFLVQHLNLLCSHNKIPYLHMIGLRKITNDCLGFPCIALGFKNNSDFSEAINEIKVICKDFKNSEISEESESETDSEIVTEEIQTKEEEPPFTYLYRSSTKERVFIPESLRNGKATDGFMPVEIDEDAKPEKVVSGVSASLIKKTKEKLKQKKEMDSSSDEDFVVPKKKQKKAWVIDKTGVKQKPKYCPVNLVKVTSNPNRVGRKKKV